MTQANDCPLHGAFVGERCPACVYREGFREEGAPEEAKERNPFYERATIAQITSRLLYPPPKKRRPSE